MWWLIVPGVLGLGKVIYDVATKRDPATTSFDSDPNRILVKNLRALGMSTIHPNPNRIALLGQPGAGKSTILKKMSKGRAKPAPVIGTNTDATNWAESTDVALLSEWSHHVASDVPGYDTSSHPVSVFLAGFPFANFGKILLVLRGKVREADVQIYRQIRAKHTPVVMVRSCAESLDPSERRAVQNDLCRQFPGLTKTSIVFVSSRTGEGIDTLRAMI